MQMTLELVDAQFEKRYMMALEHVNMLHQYITRTVKDKHKKHSGFITIAVKRTDDELKRFPEDERESKTFEQFHYRYDELVRDLSWLLLKYEDRDMYITANTTWQNRRVVDGIRQYRSIWADLDCSKVGLTPEEAHSRLSRYVFGKTLPMPSYVVYSGTGLWVYWNLEPVCHYGAELRWRGVIRQFSYLMKEYGADFGAIDPVRVCRLAGTYNSKNGKLAEIQVLDKSTRHDLEALAKEYLPVIDGYSPKWTRKSNVQQIPTESNYFYQLSQDILRLAEIRNYDIKSRKGCSGREVFLFCFRHFREQFHGDRELALQETLELNSKLTKPLSNARIRDTRSRKGVVYRYARKTLIELFGITVDEQRSLSQLVGKVVRHERNLDRWKEYQAKKRQESGVTPRSVKREQDIQTLVDALTNEPTASLRRLSELTGFGKDKCGELKKEAESRLSEKPLLTMVELPHSLPSFDVVGEVACTVDALNSSSSDTDKDTLWIRCLEVLGMEMEREGMLASFNMFFMSSVAMSYTNGILIVGLQHEFARSWIEKRTRHLVYAVCKVIGLSYIEFVIRE